MSIATVSSYTDTFEWTVSIPQKLYADGGFNGPDFDTIFGSLYLQLFTRDDDIYVGLYSTDSKRMTVRYTLWIHKDGELLKECHNLQTFHESLRGEYFTRITKPSTDSTFVFSVKFHGSSGVRYCRNTISENITLMFNDTDTTDVELNVEEKVIRAHKTILIARSQYFATMFGSGLKESLEEATNEKPQVIRFPDDSFGEMRLLVYHIYTGHATLPDDDVEAKDILRVATKYQATDLILVGEEKAIRDLSSENVAKVFFDYGFRYPNLKKECIRMLSMEEKEPLTSDEFKSSFVSFSIENGKVLFELFKGVVDSRDQFSKNKISQMGKNSRKRL